MAGIDEYTVLMLHCDGADQSTTFTDSSTTPHTVTANGNAQVDTAVKKFGTGSAMFDGTGDYLSVPDSSDWDLLVDTTDYTIDFWIKLTNHAADDSFIEHSTDGNNFWLLRHRHGTGFQFMGYTTGTDYLFWTAGGEITDSNWHHVALIKDGADYEIFIDGTSIDTLNDADTGGPYGGSLLIGDRLAGGNAVDGYMDEIRITKGTARWTSNFTPPTAPYGVDAAGNSQMMGANF